MTHHDFTLTASGPCSAVADAELDAASAALGLALPPSYRAFARRFGYGRLAGLLLVYVPLGDHCDALVSRSRVLADVIRESIDADLVEYDPDGSADLVASLVPFGVSENGHVLAWGSPSGAGDGERDIYVLGTKMLSVTRAAPSLYALVAGLSDDRVRPTLGPGYRPLPATFDPLTPG